MKKHLLLLLMVLFFACSKKSTDVVAPVAPAGPVNLATKPVVIIAATTTSNYYGSSYGADSVKYFYNSNNMLTHVVKGKLDTEFKYDKNGLLISIGKVGDAQYNVINYDNNGIITDEVTKLYDTKGILTKTTLTKFTVNNGLVTSLSSYDESNTLLSTSNLGYDANGNVATSQVTDAKTNVKTTSVTTYGTHHSLFFNSRIKFYLANGFADLFSKNEIVSYKTDAIPPFGFTPYTSYYYTFNNDYQATYNYNFSGYEPKRGDAFTSNTTYTYANL